MMKPGMTQTQISNVCALMKMAIEHNANAMVAYANGRQAVGDAMQNASNELISTINATYGGTVDQLASGSGGTG